MATVIYITKPVESVHGVAANCWSVHNVMVDRGSVTGNISLRVDIAALGAGKEILDNCVFRFPYATLAQVTEQWIYEQVQALGPLSALIGEVDFAAGVITTIEV